MIEKQNFVAHLTELKKRLTYVTVFFLITFSISYAFSTEIYEFLLKPLKNAYGNSSQHYMIYTGLTEAFFTYLKLSLFTAFMMSFPIILMQIYSFMAPGLYAKEKKVLLPYFIATPLLFIMGSGLVYYYIFPLAWKFFISFENVTANSPEVMKIKLEARVSEYLSLAMQLIIAFGMAFQLPVILTLLVRIELITAEWLSQKRKFAIVIIFAVAAILTPPDIISQVGLAIPMLLLYELSVFCSKIIEKGRKKDA